MNELTTTTTTELTVVTERPLEQNPAAVFLRRQKGAKENKSTFRLYKGDLDLMAGLLGFPDALGCPWERLRYEHTAALQADLQEYVSETTGEPLTAATVNRMISVLRGVLKTAWRLHLMTTDDYMRAGDLEPVRGKRLPAGRDLNAGEIKALYNDCANDPSPAGARDAAMLACMYPGGMRRAEVVALNLDDYDPESGRLVIRGKGNKEREGFIDNGAKIAFDDWLNIRGNEPGPMFWPIDKGGSLTPDRLTTQAIYNVCEKRRKRAKVAPFTPHDLRRTTAGDFLDAGEDLSTVQTKLGHASPETTARYDRRGSRAQKKAAGRLHIPYTGRMV